MDYWRISSSSIRNIELALEHKTWGMGFRWEGSLKKVKKGDRVVFYTSENHSFIAICEITKEHFIDHSRIWPDAEYPYRIGIKALSASQKPVGLKEARAFARNPKLGGVLMPPIRRLAPDDFNIILRMMTKK